MVMHLKVEFKDLLGERDKKTWKKEKGKRE